MIKGSKKENGREVRFSIRLTKEELELLKKQAELKKQNMTEYLVNLIKQDEKNNK